MTIAKTTIKTDPMTIRGTAYVTGKDEDFLY